MASLRPNKRTNNSEEHINSCSGCPYAICEEPEPVAGFMFSMCGVRVGSIGIAAEPDIIGEKLSGVERFTKNDGDPASKLEILNQIKAYTEKDRWKFEGFSKCWVFLKVAFNRIIRIDQVTCRAEGTGPKADHPRRAMIPTIIYPQ